MDLSRVSSGIPGLDTLLSGGFAKGSVNMISGGAGSGKTTACMQFLIEGASCGERGIYACRDSIRKTVDVFLKRFPELPSFLKDGKIILAELSHDSDIAADVAFILKDRDVRRITIDPAILSHENRGKEIMELHGFLGKKGCVSLITAEVGGGGRAHPAEAVADCVISLSASRIGPALSRSLRLKKMRGSKHSESVHPYIITEKGLEVF